MKITIKKKYVGYSVKQNRAFFFFLWLSTFCSGLIFYANFTIGYITILSYVYVWWRWSVNNVWFLDQ